MINIDTQRMQELVKRLQECSRAYYVYDNPILTDAQYDILCDELAALEQKTGIVLKGSPNAVVQGEVVSKLTKVKHTSPMLSCQKSTDKAAVRDFVGDKTCILSYKLDGLTIVLRYKDGKLVKAITRGNGVEGEDVTHNFRLCRNLPPEIPFKGELELRGEGVISWKNFEKINAELPDDEKYAHPRNLASGSVRQLDSKLFRDRYVDFVAFALVTAEGENFNTKFNTLAFLTGQGFKVVPWLTVDVHFASELEMLDRKTYEYPTDGHIFEYNDLAYGRSLGSTSHHPNNMFALKPKNETVETIFRGIDYKTSRNGVVSLTAMFDDCVIDGTVVNRASVHNVDIFRSYNFGVGDTISVYKANMIIPQILENFDQSGTYQLIDKCPTCGHSLKIVHPNNTDLLYCPNENCQARQIGRLVHFVSKPCMNIDGLSEQTLQKLMDMGLVTDFHSIYLLPDNKEGLERLANSDGFGEKSVSKLCNAIIASKNTILNRFINALGIPNVGANSSKIIAKACDYEWHVFVDKLVHNYNFSNLEDFGDITNDSIYTWAQVYLADAMVLANCMTFEKINSVVATDSPISGKKFCITGSFAQSRDDLKAALEAKGGIWVGSVSKKLDLLFCGDKAGSKLSKAKELGVSVATEADLLELIK